jgi:hypothetical protein
MVHDFGLNYANSVHVGKVKATYIPDSFSYASIGPLKLSFTGLFASGPSSFGNSSKGSISLVDTGPKKICILHLCIHSLLTRTVLVCNMSYMYTLFRCSNLFATRARSTSKTQSNEAHKPKKGNMRLHYEVKDANGMTIGAATSPAGAVAVAQQVHGAAYIFHAKTAHSFWLDWPERGYLAGAQARSSGLE